MQSERESREIDKLFMQRHSGSGSSELQLIEQRMTAEIGEKVKSARAKVAQISDERRRLLVSFRSLHAIILL
jgi:hypothetical protein